MEPTDLTLRILTEIRDSIQETNARLDQTNSKLDHHIASSNARMARLEDRIEETNSHLVQAEVRLGTNILTLAGTLDSIRTMLRDRLDLNDRVDRCESDIALLKKKTGID